MKILNSAILIGIAQLSKILLGLFLIKVIALYLGPEGLGRLGHLISLVAFLATISGGGIQNGVVKYVSEYKYKPIYLVRFVGISARYSLIVSLVFLVLFSVFSQRIALFLFSDASLYWVVVAVGFFQVFIAFNKLVSSVANGFKDTKVYASSQIIGNILSIPLIWWFVYQYQFVGGVFAVLISFLVMFFPSLYFFKKSFFWRFKKIWLRGGKKYNKLYGFSLMALVSAVVFPFVEIYIRQMLIESSGYGQAGIWQAAIKISSVYVGFFGLFLAYYFVPSVSPIKDAVVIKNMVWKYMFVIGGLFALGSLVFYSGRHVFISLLLSEEFSSLSEIIHLQLLGDFFKILGFVIGFVFVAKAFIWIYVVMEVAQGLLLALFVSWFYENNPQIQSVFEGYVVTNLLFFIFLLMVFYFYVSWPTRKGSV